MEQGDCLYELGKRHCIPWKKIWEDDENERLRLKRKDPSVLFPGDRIFIPDLGTKHLDCATEQRHVFRHPAEMALKVRVLSAEHVPMEGVDYEFVIDGVARRPGKTTSDGTASTTLSPKDVAAKLRLPWGEFPMQIGCLDPANTVSGIQQRLKSLGFDPVWIDGIWGPKTRSALIRFQMAEKSRGLEPSGTPDEKTIKALRDVHESKVLEGECNVLSADQSVAHGEEEGFHRIEAPADWSHDFDIECVNPLTDHESIVAQFLKANQVTLASEWQRHPMKMEKLTSAPDWDYDTIVIHHSGDAIGQPRKTIWDIEKKHVMDKGWDAVGYHFLIDRDGNRFEGRPLLYKGSHVEAANTGKIGICLIGDYEHQWWDDDDDISAVQMSSCASLAKALMGVFPTLRVLGGHKDWKRTTECPGNALYAELSKLRGATGLSAP